MFAGTKSIWRRLLGHPETEASVALRDPEADRRIWMRFPADLETILKPAGAPDSAHLSAKVRNISLGGINVITNRAFQPGDLLTIELPRAIMAAHCKVLACVVRCEKDKGGRWSLGCSFARELSEDDLESVSGPRFSNSPENAPAVEQRVYERVACSIPATFHLAAAEHALPRLTQVLNLSLSGIGLLVDHAVENGTLLNVELHSPDGQTERMLLACVVHVTRRADAEWALGCNFIRSLAEEDLGALLR